MKTYNWKLKQELIKAQYSNTMVIAIDMLQDPNVDMETVERRAKNMLASDKLSDREKEELKDFWIPNARQIAEFNALPD